MTNVDWETQKFQKRPAKPLVARLKYKWSKKKRKEKEDSAWISNSRASARTWSPARCSSALILDRRHRAHAFIRSWSEGDRFRPM
jgi:hypothetical protein